MVKEGISGYMRRVAEGLELVGDSFDAKRRDLALVAVRCEQCDWACSLVDEATGAMDGACALAVLFPAMMEVCAAAVATWATVAGACYGCLAVVGGSCK